MCQGLTKKQLRCKNPGEPYCWLHVRQAPPDPIHIPEPVEVEKTKDPYKELYEDLVIQTIVDNEDYKNSIEKLEKELSNYKKMQECIFQEKLKFKSLYHSTQNALKKNNKEYKLLLSDKKFLDEYALIDHYINLKVYKHTKQNRNYNNNVKNNIWDFNRIPNIGKIIYRELGISYKEFNYKFARIKRERIKLAHPRINLEYSDLLKTIKDII